MNSSPFSFEISPGRKLVSFLSLFLGVGFLGLYFVRAPSGDTLDRVFVLDTSLSMAVQDIVGTGGIYLSRLDASKTLTKNLLSEQNALMTFSDESTMILPLSPDRETFSAVLDALEPVLYGKSTHIESALSALSLIYPRTNSIVLITDGEDTAGNTITSSGKVQKYTNLTIIGVGSEAGGPMLQGYDSEGRARYKQFESKDAISKRDTKNLQRISDMYGADLLLVDSIAELNEEKIASLTPSSSQAGKPNLFLIVGCSLFLLGAMLHPYKNQL